MSSARSILVPFGPVRPQQVLPFAALAQWGDSAALWQGQAAGTDALLNFAYASDHGFATPVGTAVSLMPFAHPFDAAMRATTLVSATGNPATICFGPGSTSLQRGLLGAPYRSPLGAAREYVTIVRSLVDTGEAAFSGEFYSCSMRMPHMPRPKVSVGLGVLRSRMAELAGEVADVAVTWLTPANYIRDVIRPALVRGATRAGRPVPRIVAMVPVSLAQNDRDPVDVALASSKGHMSLPHYVAMLDSAGVRVDVDADPRASAQALIDGGAFLAGDRASVESAMSDYDDAGVSEIVLNLSGVAELEGHRAALADLETLVDAA
ncbi:MAG TPA: LLM class flavin-dependent oxidoreductase [Candidatus Microbacterium stercoravium]|uniref:LLM class flavin-dependent oxidoreductase n=1 Tax=Candidatus Microbacterium stercoravium TaxID=2838697 RepID=A0A9D2KIE1_9MICO|nr:LLM class flavin-dependent oxidoreductase [Candidatus Microbacterium stercoravium]